MMKCIFLWLITGCRIGLGLVVMKTGYDFAAGNGSFAYRETDMLTGGFVMIIGAYCIVSSFTRLFPKQSD